MGDSNAAIWVDGEARITYTLTDTPGGRLDGLTFTDGLITKGGTSVEFREYLNREVWSATGLRPGGVLEIRVAGKPALEALVAQAVALPAAIKAEAASLVPVGLEWRDGCDRPSSYRLIWPKTASEGAIEAREEDEDRIGKQLTIADLDRIAAETGATAIEADLGCYRGWRYGADGVAAILALVASRQRDAAITAVAKAGTKPAEATTWTEPCDGSAPDCSLDLCRRVTLADGTTRVVRTHTH